MKAPTVLYYNLEGEKGARLRYAAMLLKIRLRPVKPEEYGQTLAALCGEEPVREDAPAGEAFLDEMLVMAYFPDRLISLFTDALRRIKAPSVGLKAILTETNSQWDSRRLHEELSAEKAALEKNGAPAHGAKG